MRYVSFTLVAILLIAMAGCSSDPRAYHVKGAVTYKGSPVPAGVLFFDPDVSKKNDGPQGYAFIKDGAFDTAATGGKGIVGGAYIVRIQGFDGKPGQELPMGRMIFKEHQETVDFPKENNTRDFQVDAK
jgi:hypothetical protein